MATTATLLCKQCNFENEPERVYCHNCGAKLDRTLLPPEAIKREDPQLVQDRVRAAVRPKRFYPGRVLVNLAISLPIAATAAVLFLISQPPINQLKPLSEDDVMGAPAISDDLQDMAESPTVRRVAYTEDQVNGFLQGAIKGKDASTYGIPTRFVRAYVDFQEGFCHATIEESIFGYSFFISSSDGVEIKNGQLVTRPVAASIGRLPFPTKMLPYVEKTFAPVWGTLDVYKKLVARMGDIAFHPGKVVLTGKAGK